MKKAILKKAVLSLALAFGFTSMASAAHLSNRLTFSARMNGAQEVPAVTTNAAGVASLVLNPTRDTLCISVYMGGFSSAVNGIHLHQGAAGTNGAVLVDLTPYLTKNNVQAVLTGANLPAGLVQAMLEGNIYLNAHNAANPNGEIRGQVKLETDFAYRALLNGANEVPAVATSATGLGIFNLSLNKKKMYYWIVANGVSGAITGAHFHTAAAGSNGGVAYDLTPTISGNTIMGTVDVSTVAGFIDSLEAGKVYINLHTAANGNGEIRGQLALSNRVEFDAFLNTAQEVPAPTGSSATGTAYFSLNSTYTALTYEVQVDGLTGAIGGAHLHAGVAGVAGPVLVDLSGGVNGNRISGTITGADLTDELIDGLLESGVYINIHTMSNMNGEIRGQLNRVAREGYTVRMDGAQEVPAVTTAANGGGIITISRERNNAHIMLVAKDLSGALGGAHLHKGAVGQAGPVLLDLSSFFAGNAAFTAAYTYLTSEDASPFGPAQELLFRQDSVYVNLHTAANMNGEIRGHGYRGSECFNVSAVGIDEAVENTIAVYPNPTSSSITISKDGFTSAETLVVLDITGKTVKSINFTANGQTVDMSDLKSGIYFLKDAKNNAIKIIKD